MSTTSIRLALAAFFFVAGGISHAALAEDAQVPVRAASEPAYPPLCTVDSQGEAAGFAVDLLRASLKAVGREAVFEVGPWHEIRQALEEGRIDVLPLVGRTPEREEIFDFTFPYLVLHGAIFVREGDVRIQGLEDLADKEVLVMAGDNAEEFVLREDVAGEVIATETYEEAFRLLSEGRHDAVVAQKLMGLALLQQLGITNVQPIGEPLSGFRQEFCFAVKEGDKDLLALLNEGLAITVGPGNRKQLEHKWLTALNDPDRPRTLVFGGDHDYPPYEFIGEDGEPTGFNVELTRAVAAAVGLEAEIRLGPWGEVRSQLERGQIDAVQGMFYSEERDKTADFSVPHQIIHHAVFAGPHSPPYSSEEDMSGYSVAVMRGDIMHDYALGLDFPLDIHAAETQEGALEMLQAGQADFALVAHLPGLYWVDLRGWNRLKAVDTQLESPEYGYAVPEGDAYLLTLLNSGLAYVRSTGEFKRIQQRWLGVLEPRDIPWPQLLQYGGLVMGGLLLLLALSLMWSRMLRLQVARKTRELEELEEERRRMEGELRQAHKMEAIGHLAGGVAHDFNNIMQVIQGYAQLLLQTSGEGTETHEFSKEIEKGASRAASLTAQLLAFGRRQVMAMTDVDVNALIHDLLRLLERTLGEHIQLTFKPSPGAGTAHADPNQIGQVLINLCVNARDAMANSGQLTIETDRVALDEAFCAANAWARPGWFSVISVTDTGCGIDEATQERIFEPFFTTKEQGKGTGLGLSTAYGIIKQHDGLIDVSSQLGQGTTFRVYLPAADGFEESADIKTEQPLSRGYETILLAEDDDSIRRLTVRLLEEAGYTVITAGDGEEATRIIEERQHEIDMVVLDVIMPVKSGREVFEFFKERKPEGKALFISGYSTGVIDNEFLEEHDVRCIHKPFSPRTLLEAIRNALAN